jgi:hypothetical protein
VEVPYVTLTEYNLVNPYHKTHFNEYSFDFFEPGKLRGAANEDYGVTFKKLWHRFHYLEEFRSVPEPLLGYMRRHLFNVVKSISFGIVAIKTPGAGIDARITPQSLEKEFDACLIFTRRAPWTVAGPSAENSEGGRPPSGRDASCSP